MDERTDRGQSGGINVGKSVGPVSGDIVGRDKIIKVSPKIVSANCITVHGDLNLGDQYEVEQSTPLSYTRIQLDHKFWDTESKPRAGWKLLYPFDLECDHYYYLKSHLERADPYFDIIVTNNRDYQTIILSIGLNIIQTADVTYAYGGPPVTSFRITLDDIFAVDMPELKSPWPSLSKSYPPQREDIETVARNVSASIAFDDPLALEGRRSYRFGLYLDNYVDNIPNNAICRISIGTNHGAVESGNMYLFTC